MKIFVFTSVLLMSSAAMATDLNSAKALFFSTLAQEVSYDVESISFTTAEDTGAVPSGGGTEYYLVAWTNGPVMLKCDGLVVVRNGLAVAILPKSFTQLCRPID